MNPRDRLQYALYLQRLHELFVIKENIAFQYQNAHYNKAAEQIDKVVDKCLDNNIKAVVDGTHNLETPNLDHVISGALSSQQKMLVKTEDRYIQSAVEQNTKQFTTFIQNRIEKENYSLQAKIQKEYEKKKYKGMPEEEAKKLISEKFKDSARKRSKNIVKDALHTNQSQISWTYNVNNGMKYKVWMNGQSKSGVRSWHIKSKIQPVEIDDFFDIYGPKGHARMMYPGDLNGGAENVANCKCWLHYTNIAPSNLKPRGTIQINPNVNISNNNARTFSPNTGTKGRKGKPKGSESTSSSQKGGLFTKIRNKLSDVKEKISNKFKSAQSDAKSTMRSLFSFSDSKDSATTRDNENIITKTRNAEELFKEKGVSNELNKSLSHNWKKLKDQFRGAIPNQELDDIFNHFLYFTRSKKDWSIEHCTIKKADGTIMPTIDGDQFNVEIPEDIREEGKRSFIDTVIHNHPRGYSPFASLEDIVEIAECGIKTQQSSNEFGTMTITNKDIQGNKENLKDINKTMAKIYDKIIDDFETAENDGKKVDRKNPNDVWRLNQFVNKHYEKYHKLYEEELADYMEVSFIKHEFQIYN